MTKDEMKDRISMALKDQVLQQGFELICKNLAELESENRLMQLKLDALDGYIPWDEIANCNKQITELKKENAELKSLTDFQIWSNIDNYSILKRSKEQLTKAKELLKRCYENYIHLEPLRSEIEQFLKEVHNDERPVQTDDEDKACH